MIRTHVDLFSGIGGFALAAKANGVRTIQFVEIDARCRTFLAKAWPGVPIHDDIRTFRMADSTGNGREVESSERRTRAQSSSCTPVWLLTAGVPCQPASRAGKQRGSADGRWLWPEALRCLAEIRPAWALFENPPGIGDVGLAGILAEMEGRGYEVRVLGIPACAVGAPHRRMRYWIVAHAADGKRERNEGQQASTNGLTKKTQSEPARSSTGHVDECGSVGLGDSEVGTERAGLCTSGPGEVGRGRSCDSGIGDCSLADTDEGRQQIRWAEGRDGDGERDGSDESDAIQNSGFWSRYVWLPCADGKVRRAPPDAFRLVDGLHRSVLGALGNSIVWQVAAEIIRAMILAEESELR